MSTRRPALPLPLLVAALLLTAGPAHAEVAVHLAERGDEYDVISSSIVRITDDSSPLGMWAAVSPPSAGRIVLNESGGALGDGEPSLIHDAASGLVAAAWSRDLGGVRGIVVSHFDGAAWTAPLAVSASPAEDEVEPKLVVDAAQGLVHLVYRVDGATPRIEHRQAPLDLSSWSAPAPVSAPGDVALRPAAVVAAGTLWIAYETHPLGIGVTPRQIAVAEARPDGTYVAEIVATTYHGDPNRPEIHAAPGRLWIDWIDAEGDLAFSVRSPGGAWQTPLLEAYEGAEDRDFAARARVRGRVFEMP